MVAASSNTYTVDLYKGITGIGVVNRQRPAISSVHLTMYGSTAHIRGLPHELFARCEAEWAMATAQLGEAL